MSKKIGIPANMPALIPHLHFNGNCRSAVDWYQVALGAELEAPPVSTPDGKQIMHAMLRINGSPFMVADSWPGWEHGPREGATAGMWIYVEDCDALWKGATEVEGAEVLMPLADMFWGDRMGKLKDPFGHTWSIATQIELSEEEKKEMAAEQMG